jgi:hypothetical protein
MSIVVVSLSLQSSYHSAQTRKKWTEHFLDAVTAANSPVISHHLKKSLNE